MSAAATPIADGATAAAAAAWPPPRAPTAPSEPVHSNASAAHCPGSRRSPSIATASAAVHTTVPTWKITW